MSRRVFISYSTKDEQDAALLEECLSSLKPDDHIDSIFRCVQIPAGNLWEEIIHKELRDSDVGISLVTPKYLASKWCLLELDYFARRLKIDEDFLFFPIHLKSSPLRVATPDLLETQFCPSVEESVYSLYGETPEQIRKFCSEFVELEVWPQIVKDGHPDDDDPDPEPPSPGSSAALRIPASRREESSEAKILLFKQSLSKRKLFSEVQADLFSLSRANDSWRHLLWSWLQKHHNFLRRGMAMYRWREVRMISADSLGLVKHIYRPRLAGAPWVVQLNIQAALECDLNMRYRLISEYEDVRFDLMLEVLELAIMKRGLNNYGRGMAASLLVVNYSDLATARSCVISSTINNASSVEFGGLGQGEIYPSIFKGGFIILEKSTYDEIGKPAQPSFSETGLRVRADSRERLLSCQDIDFFYAITGHATVGKSNLLSNWARFTAWGPSRNTATHSYSLSSAIDRFKFLVTAARTDYNTDPMSATQVLRDMERFCARPVLWMDLSLPLFLRDNIADTFSTLTYPDEEDPSFDELGRRMSYPRMLEVYEWLSCRLIRAGLGADAAKPHISVKHKSFHDSSMFPDGVNELQEVIYPSGSRRFSRARSCEMDNAIFLEMDLLMQKLLRLNLRDHSLSSEDSDVSAGYSRPQSGTQNFLPRHGYDFPAQEAIEIADASGEDLLLSSGGEIEFVNEKGLANTLPLPDLSIANVGKPAFVSGSNLIESSFRSQGRIAFRPPASNTTLWTEKIDGPTGSFPKGLMSYKIGEFYDVIGKTSISAVVDVEEACQANSTDTLDPLHPYNNGCEGGCEGDRTLNYLIGMEQGRDYNRGIGVKLTEEFLGGVPGNAPAPIIRTPGGLMEQAEYKH